MVMVSAAVAAVALYVLYQAAFEQQRVRLTEVVQSRARSIEAVASHEVIWAREAAVGGDANLHPDNVLSSAAAITLNQIVEAHENFEGFGATGEFTLAQREGDRIGFLLSLRHGSAGDARSVPFDAEVAEAMRRALRGESGAVVGLDYRGVRVLAAYEPVAELGWGVVAKIDIAEIRAPFVRAGLLAAGIALLVSSLGAGLVAHLIALLLRSVERAEIGRKRAQSGLRNSEIRSRTLLEGSPVCNKIINLDSRLQYMSAAGVKQLKIPDIRPFYGCIYPPEFYPESMRIPLIEHLERAKAGETCSVECPVLDMEGCEVWYHTTFVPARDDEGRIDYIIAASVDITDRKRAEEELRRSQEDLEIRVQERTTELAEANANLKREVEVRRVAEEAVREFTRRNEAILAAVPDIVMEVDIHKVYTWTNPAGYDFFGEDVLGKEAASYFEGEQDTYEAVAPMFAGDERVFYVESWQRRSDGAKRLLAWWGRVLKDEEGHPRGALSTARDITDQRRAEEEARSRQAEMAHLSRLGTMGEMASGIAHELNQPLTAISNYSGAWLRMLRSGVWNRDELLEDLGQINAQATRSGEIIRRLRSLVRKQQPQTATTRLETIITDTIDLLQAELRQSDVAIRLELGDALPPVSVDAIQVQQVVLNLAQNGIEAMGQSDRRELTFAATMPDSTTIEVAVHDTGGGLSEGAADEVFEAFFSTKPQGLGIGLSISRSIVEAHGGRLWATSNCEGGTTFRFTLAVAA
jgi:PAS domain S-box-containing protein